jgi:hypothetical protein
MKRKTIAIAAGVAALALSGTVLIARAGPGGGGPEGVTAGLSKATNNVTACVSVGGGGGLCTVAVHGAYFDKTLLGNGTYQGTLTIHWSTYAFNPNQGQSGENCADVTGQLVLTSGSSVLKGTLISAGSVNSPNENSLVCEQTAAETGGFLYNRNVELNAQITSANGKFQHVIPKQSQFGLFFGSSNEMDAATQTKPIATYLDEGGTGSALVIG